MMASTHISPNPVSLPLPVPASHPLSTIPQPATLPLVFASILARLLCSAAAVLWAPPYRGNFLEICLVPWLVVKIRLRRNPFHRIAAPLTYTVSHREHPDLPPSLDPDPSGGSRAPRLPIWWSGFVIGLEAELTINFKSQPDLSMESGDDQSEPMWLFSQAWSRAEPSCPSQVDFLLDNRATKSSFCWSQAEPVNQAADTRRSPSLNWVIEALIINAYSRKDGDGEAQFFEPFSHE